MDDQSSPAEGEREGGWKNHMRGAFGGCCGNGVLSAFCVPLVLAHVQAGTGVSHGRSRAIRGRWETTEPSQTNMM